MNFLDDTLTRGGDESTTCVHRKPYGNQTIQTSDHLNIKSYHRGFSVPNPWKTFHAEVIRIKSLLNNINFPNKLVENKVNKFVSSKFRNLNNEEKAKINFCFCNAMTENYNKEEKKLQIKISDTTICIQLMKAITSSK